MTQLGEALQLFHVALKFGLGDKGSFSLFAFDQSFFNQLIDRAADGIDADVVGFRHFLFGHQAISRMIAAGADIFLNHIHQLNVQRRDCGWIQHLHFPPLSLVSFRHVIFTERLL